MTVTERLSHARGMHGVRGAAACENGRRPGGAHAALRVAAAHMNGRSTYGRRTAGADASVPRIAGGGFVVWTGDGGRFLFCDD